MALTVPQSRSVLPEQNAPQGIDPSRQFGNQIANPINLPDVLQGQGGYQIDTSAEAAAYAKFGATVGSAVQQVVDDQAKKELALRRATEHVEFEKSKVNLDNAASELMQVTQKQLQDGLFFDDQDAKDHFAREYNVLKNKHLPENRFTDLDVSTNAKIYGAQVDGKYIGLFRDNVIIPEQTTKYLKTEAELTQAHNQKSLNDGSTLPIEQLKTTIVENATRINKKYDSPEMAVLLGPKGVEPARQKELSENAMSFITGMANRGFKEGMSPLQVAKQTIKNNTEIKALLLDGGGFKLGNHLDEVARKIDSTISQASSEILRIEEREERKREAAAAKAKARNLAEFERHGSLYGEESPLFKKVMSGQAGPEETVAFFRGHNSYTNRQSTELGLAMGHEKNLGKRDSLVNPTPQETKAADASWKMGLPEYNKMTPEQQRAERAKHYVTGAVPPTLLNDIQRKMKSDDPKIVADALEQMTEINTINPKALGKFNVNEMSMLTAFKAGNSPEKLIKYRDNQANLSETEKATTINNTAYAAAKLGSGEKNEAGWQTKVGKDIRSESGNFWSSAKDIDKQTVDHVADLTKTIISSAPGISYKDALKQALSTVSRVTGVTAFSTKPNTVQMFAPEAVSGMTEKEIRKDYGPYIESVKANIPVYQAVPSENFTLKPTPKTSATKPVYEVWYKDGQGNEYKVYDNNHDPVYFKVQRKGS